MIPQKTQRLRVRAGAIALAVAFALGGCGSDDSKPETTDTSESESPAEESGSGSPASDNDVLASYVEKVQAEVEDEVARYEDVYSDFSLEAENGNTIVYTYTFRDPMDVSATRKNLESTAEILKTTARDMIVPEMESLGIDNPAVKWVYLNNDGAEISTIVFES